MWKGIPLCREIFFLLGQDIKMRWVDALKEWNAKKGGAYVVPRKGTKEHAEVKALMGGAKPDAECVENIKGGCGMCGGSRGTREPTPAMQKAKLLELKREVAEDVKKEEAIPKPRPTNQKKAEVLFEGGQKKMKYWEAVRKWNADRKEAGKGQAYCIPKKGSPDYNEVLKLMSGDDTKPKEDVKKDKDISPEALRNFNSANDPEYFKQSSTKERNRMIELIYGLDGEQQFVKQMKPHLLKAYRAWCKRNKRDCTIEGGKKVSMPKKSYMNEHKRLIELLESISKKLQAESTEQMLEVLDQAKRR